MELKGGWEGREAGDSSFGDMRMKLINFSICLILLNSDMQQYKKTIYSLILSLLLDNYNHIRKHEHCQTPTLVPPKPRPNPPTQLPHSLPRVAGRRPPWRRFNHDYFFLHLSLQTAGSPVRGWIATRPEGHLKGLLESVSWNRWTAKKYYETFHFIVEKVQNRTFQWTAV